MYRILILIGIVLTLVLVGKFSPLGQYLSIPYLKEWILGAGFWGFFIFMAAFLTASLLNLPGSVFLVLAILVFGYWQGAGITYVSAFLSANTTFFLARRIGGRKVPEVRNVRIRRLISQAERFPVRTLLLFRTFMQLSPLVGYLLALTGIRPRAYVLGNAIAIWIPIAYISLLVFLLQDQFIRWLGLGAI